MGLYITDHTGTECLQRISKIYRKVGGSWQEFYDSSPLGHSFPSGRGVVVFKGDTYSAWSGYRQSDGDIVRHSDKTVVHSYTMDININRTTDKGSCILATDGNFIYTVASSVIYYSSDGVNYSAEFFSFSPDWAGVSPNGEEIFVMNTGGSIEKYSPSTGVVSLGNIGAQDFFPEFIVVNNPADKIVKSLSNTIEIYDVSTGNLLASNSSDPDINSFIVDSFYDSALSSIVSTTGNNSDSNAKIIDLNANITTTATNLNTFFTNTNSFSYKLDEHSYVNTMDA